MFCKEGIRFYEGTLLVKALVERDDLVEAYKLRHKVYSENLQWVPPSQGELEVDTYDTWATAIGVFCESRTLLGFSRVLPAPGPFMLDSEFRTCLKPGYRLRREQDTAEITRLTVAPNLDGKGLSSRVLLALLKGLYQLLADNGIRYCYMVVEQRLLRVLRVIGFPCEQIGASVALPPAAAVSVAAVLDLERFRCEAAESRPEFLRWITTSPCAVDADRRPARSEPGTGDSSGTRWDMGLGSERVGHPVRLGGQSIVA